jgi:hypothetical protein
MNKKSRFVALFLLLSSLGANAAPRTSSPTGMTDETAQKDNGRPDVTLLKDTPLAGEDLDAAARRDAFGAPKRHAKRAGAAGKKTAKKTRKTHKTVAPTG